MDRMNKVIWSEGMFLSPQHFQQQERYLEHYAQRYFQSIHGYLSGLTSLQIDKSRLRMGKIAVRSASGIFPDGTSFELANEIVLDIPVNILQKKVYLALPIVRAGVLEIASNTHVRFHSKQVSLFDVSREQSEPLDVQVGELTIVLKLEGEDLSDYVVLAITEVIEHKSDGELVLNQGFIPQCIHANVSSYLSNALTDIYAQMQYRANTIAVRLQADVQRKSYQALLRDYLWLQALGNWQPKLMLWIQDPSLMTKTLYYECVAMAGQFSGLEGEVLTEVLPWNDQDLFAIFSPIFSKLHLLLHEVQLDNVTTLKWDTQLFAPRRLLRTLVENRRLFQDGRFILVVNSPLGGVKLSEEFPRAAKLSGNSDIARIVRHSLSGVPLRNLPYAPSELKSQADAAYFELDTKSELWLNAIQKEELIALHIDERLEDIRVDFYVIR